MLSAGSVGNNRLRSTLLQLHAQRGAVIRWARGYFVSTVGRDEAAIREYIKSQEKEDQRLEQLNLWR
jgi:REP element-mobilizing transposase RayT